MFAAPFRLGAIASAIRVVIASAGSTSNIDPHFDKVALLLHGNGTNASTLIVDSSASARTITPLADAKISTVQSKFGGASIAFDGTGDYATAPYSTDWNIIGTGSPTAATIEFWVYPSSLPGSVAGLVSWCDMVGSTNAWELCLSSTGAIFFRYWNGASQQTTTSSTIAAGAWAHIALVRNGTALTIYVNGVLGATGAVTGTPEISASNPLVVGGTRNGIGGASPVYLNGYIDDLRITRGVARYTAAFTPPAQQFPEVWTDANLSSVSLLLNGNGSNGSTTIFDSSPSPKTISVTGNSSISTAQSKFGGSSIALDGTGDYIDVPGQALGTGDFTIEFWYFSNSLTSSPTLMDNRVVTPSAGLAIYVASQTTLTLQAANVDRASVAAPANSTWNHVAVSRSSGVTRFFLNGTQAGSNYADTNNYDHTTLRFGSNFPGTSSLNGYLDDIRVTKGVARYTAAFTPPALELPGANADPYFANVALSLHGEGVNGSTTIIDSSPSPKVVTANGNAQISAGRSRFGDGAIYLDGTGDFLSIPYNSAFDLNAGNFTLEGWFFQQGAGSALISLRNTGATGWALETYRFRGVINSTYSDTHISFTAPATNTWHHFALVRNGTTLSYYLNGALMGSVGSITSIANDNTQPIRIGYSNSAGEGSFQGFIDDVRWTPGVARYTAAFGVPTRQFPDAWTDPNLSNVSLLLRGDGANGSTTITDSSPSPKTPTVVGNAQVSTAVAKFGGSSLRFDGSGDSISYASDAGFGLGTADFTIEGWVYYTGATTGSYDQFLLLGSTPTVVELRFADAGFGYRLQGNVGNTVGEVLESNFTRTNAQNTWVHVAITRASGVFRFFINGVLTSSYTATKDYGTTNTFLVGSGPSAANSLNGYLDEVRVTKGLARYTATFTPPPLPFPAVIVESGAARYWRINGISVPAGGGFLEVSEINLFEGAAQATGATLTSSNVPTSGSVSALDDGQTSTRCYWPEATAEAAGFWIQWDFGAGAAKAIDGVKQAGFDTSTRHMDAFTLQYSADGTTWVTKGSKTGLTYPGNQTYSALYTF